MEVAVVEPEEEQLGKTLRLIEEPVPVEVAVVVPVILPETVELENLELKVVVPKMVKMELLLMVVMVVEVVTMTTKPVEVEVVVVEHQEERLEKEEKVAIRENQVMMVKKAPPPVEVKVETVRQLVKINTENRTVEKEEKMDMQ